MCKKKLGTFHSFKIYTDENGELHVDEVAREDVYRGDTPPLNGSTDVEDNGIVDALRAAQQLVNRGLDDA